MFGHKQEENNIGYDDVEKSRNGLGRGEEIKSTVCLGHGEYRHGAIGKGLSSLEMAGPIEGRIPAARATGDPVYRSTQGRRTLYCIGGKSWARFGPDGAGNRYKGRHGGDCVSGFKRRADSVQE